MHLEQRLAEIIDAARPHLAQLAAERPEWANLPHLHELLREINAVVPPGFARVDDSHLRQLFREAMEHGDRTTACTASRALGSLEPPECYPCDAHGLENPYVRAAWSLSTFEARLVCAGVIAARRAQEEEELEQQEAGDAA